MQKETLNEQYACAMHVKHKRTRLLHTYDCFHIEFLSYNHFNQTTEKHMVTEKWTIYVELNVPFK